MVEGLYVDPVVRRAPAECSVVSKRSGQSLRFSLNWRPVSEPDKEGKKPAILSLLHRFYRSYNVIKPILWPPCTLKNAFWPYPATGSHQQMSLRKKEESDAENAP